MVSRAAISFSAAAAGGEEVELEPVVRLRDAGAAVAAALAVDHLVLLSCRNTFGTTSRG